MINIRITLTTILCAMAALFSSCERDVAPTEGNEPIIELDCYELNVDGYGGDMALFYSITNPIKGQSMEVTSNVDWITLKSINSYSIILDVEASDELETRHGIVTIRYKYMTRPLKVYVKQDKMVMDYFTLSAEDITYNSCTIYYTPKDDSVQYMANIIDKQYFNSSGVSTAEEFIAAEMNNYIALAKANNMTLEELMGKVSPQLIYTGDAVQSCLRVASQKDQVFRQVLVAKILFLYVILLTFVQIAEGESIIQIIIFVPTAIQILQ